MTAQIVFDEPAWLSSMKVGMTSAVSGTMTEPSRIANTAAAAEPVLREAVPGEHREHRGADPADDRVQGRVAEPAPVDAARRR